MGNYEIAQATRKSKITKIARDILDLKGADETALLKRKNALIDVLSAFARSYIDHTHRFQFINCESSISAAAKQASDLLCSNYSTKIIKGGSCETASKFAQNFLESLVDMENHRFSKLFTEQISSTVRNVDEKRILEVMRIANYFPILEINTVHARGRKSDTAIKKLTRFCIFFTIDAVASLRVKYGVTDRFYDESERASVKMIACFVKKHNEVLYKNYETYMIFEPLSKLVSVAEGKKSTLSIIEANLRVCTPCVFIAKSREYYDFIYNLDCFGKPKSTKKTYTDLPEYKRYKTIKLTANN